MKSFVHPPPLLFLHLAHSLWPVQRKKRRKGTEIARCEKCSSCSKSNVCNARHINMSKIAHCALRIIIFFTISFLRIRPPARTAPMRQIQQWEFCTVVRCFMCVWKKARKKDTSISISKEVHLSRTPGPRLRQKYASPDISLALSPPFFVLVWHGFGSAPSVRTHCVTPRTVVHSTCLLLWCISTPPLSS